MSRASSTSTAGVGEIQPHLNRGWPDTTWLLAEMYPSVRPSVVASGPRRHGGRNGTHLAVGREELWVDIRWRKGVSFQSQPTQTTDYSRKDRPDEVSLRSSCARLVALGCHGCMGNGAGIGHCATSADSSCPVNANALAEPDSVSADSRVVAMDIQHPGVDQPTCRHYGKQCCCQPTVLQCTWQRRPVLPGGYVCDHPVGQRGPARRGHSRHQREAGHHVFLPTPQR